MAFSMFLRNTACNSQLINRQVLRLASQTPMLPRSFSTVPQSRCVLNKDLKISAPILNSTRNFKTTTACQASDTPHDHARLWVIEKMTSALLVPLVPLGLLLPNRLFDVSLAILMVAHSHWGLEAIVVDYIRTSIFGPFIPKLAIGLVYLFSATVLGGLLYLCFNDIGICRTIRALWAVKSDNKN